jgi:hypothetical protein
VDGVEEMRTGGLEGRGERTEGSEQRVEEQRTEDNGQRIRGRIVPGQGGRGCGFSCAVLLSNH